MPILLADLGSGVVVLILDLIDVAARVHMLYAGGMPDGLGPAAATASALAGGAFGGADALGGPDERIVQDRERLRQARDMLDPRNSPGARQAREERGGGYEVPGAPVRPRTGGRPVPPPAPDPGIVERIRNDPGVKRYGPRPPTDAELNDLWWGTTANDD
ncbi:MAG: hypothetical protein ACRDG7_08575 [Candidatus Limnocylindria bacterium]